MPWLPANPAPLYIAQPGPPSSFPSSLSHSGCFYWVGAISRALLHLSPAGQATVAQPGADSALWDPPQACARLLQVSLCQPATCSFHLNKKPNLHLAQCRLDMLCSSLSPPGNLMPMAHRHASYTWIPNVGACLYHTSACAGRCASLVHIHQSLDLGESPLCDGGGTEHRRPLPL